VRSLLSKQFTALPLIVSRQSCRLTLPYKILLGDSNMSTGRFASDTFFEDRFYDNTGSHLHNSDPGNTVDLLVCHCLCTAIVHVGEEKG